MAYKLVILQAAADDSADAYEYYENTSPGLGDRFLSEVLERFTEISRHPQYYGFIDQQKVVRDIALKNFPYQVVYEIEDDKIIIYSIHCTYRHPDKRVRK